VEVVADDEGVLEIVCVEPDLAKDGKMDNGVGKMDNGVGKMDNGVGKMDNGVGKCGEGGFSNLGQGREVWG
jgi:X-X-X-Leu-X-X-Gly heptad repeat protein